LQGWLGSVKDLKMSNKNWILDAKRFGLEPTEQLKLFWDSANIALSNKDWILYAKKIGLDPTDKLKLFWHSAKRSGKLKNTGSCSNCEGWGCKACCACEGWGCNACCESQEEIRSRTGTFR
jgi:hypothetical protein